MEKSNEMTRRRFLVELSIAGSAALAISGCNTSARGDSSTTAVGKTSDFEAGTYKKVTLPSGASAYVTKRDGGFYALSSKCTHRGCEVLWLPGHNSFQCPCHGAQYDADGKNTRGPAQSPLAVLATHVDHDTVYVAAG